MSRSEAESLLRQADREPDRVRRHLLVAAALGLSLTAEPIVVGGTAEEYWTGAEYHPTDLDVCAPLGPEDEKALRDLGFERDGMHWVRDRGHTVAVQFPDTRIDGDESRVATERFGSATARIISLDDLYLDRLRQATANEHERSVEFMSALAVVAARYDDIDWPYVRRRLGEIGKEEPSIGASMRRIDRRLRRRVRSKLSRPE